MTAAEITSELEAALEEFRITPSRLALISPLQERKGERFSYRLEADDGRILKLRLLDSVDRATFLLEERARIEEAFAPALARCGRVLLEEWIEGQPLSPPDEDARAEEAGALLGRLHGMPLKPEVPAVFGTGEWIANAESDLELLAAANELDVDEVRSLRAEIIRLDPGSAPAALIHKDFCAENMVIDTRGRLRVIDNEQMVVEPAGFDLGRTFDRWPMSDDAWQRFLSGYRTAAPAEPRALAFWQIVATLVGARVRLQRDPARLLATLDRVRGFISGLSKG